MSDDLTIEIFEEVVTIEIPDQGITLELSQPPEAPEDVGGTSDHTQLSNRDAADQHPIGAIAGLRDELDTLAGTPGGTFDGEHNDLEGRVRILGAHPIGAIPGLLEGLTHRESLVSVDPIVVTAVGDPIAVMGTGTWDDFSIREPSPVTFDETTEQWICVYTARSVNEGVNHLGAVLSTDGETWTPHPDNPITGASNVAEDPYLTKNLDGTLYRNSLGQALMFTEEKVGARHFGIDLWVSEPNLLSGWTLVGQVIPPGIEMEPGVSYGGQPGVWDSTDRTSPTVLHTGDGNLVLLFEGRWLPDTGQIPAWAVGTSYDEGFVVWQTEGASNVFYRALADHVSETGATPDVSTALWVRQPAQEGMTGIARSSDGGVTWTVDPDPIIDHDAAGPEGVWSAVPDDLIKIEDAWVLLAHGQSAEGTNYSSIRFVTADDPDSWGPESFSRLPNPTVYAASPVHEVHCWGNDPLHAAVLDRNDEGVWAITKAAVSSLFVGADAYDDTDLVQRVQAASDLAGTANGAATAAASAATAAIDTANTAQSMATAVGVDLSTEVVKRKHGDGLLARQLANVLTATDVTGSLIDLSTFGIPGFEALAGTSDLTVDGGVTLRFNTPTTIQRGAVVVHTMPPDPVVPPFTGAVLAGMVLPNIVVDGGISTSVNLGFALSNGGFYTDFWGFVEAGDDTGLWISDEFGPRLVGPVSPTAPADLYIFGTDPAGSPFFGVQVVVYCGDLEQPLPELVSFDKPKYLWKLAPSTASEWTQVATYTTTTTNDWPTFTGVPNANRYRLRWSTLGSDLGTGGGLARDLQLTFDDDAGMNYSSAAQSLAAGSAAATATIIGKIGQGGGGRGEAVVSRVRSRQGSAPNQLHGIAHESEGVSWTATSSMRVQGSGRYNKADGTVPSLSKWAVSASNNDVWHAGITFILEVAS